MTNWNNISSNKYILENELAFWRFDDKPVSIGHILFVTKRHTETFFKTTNEEKFTIVKFAQKMKVLLDKQFYPDEHNININCGKEAGQSVMHTHVHLLPKNKGDGENSRGGVRDVNSSK